MVRKGFNVDFKARKEERCRQYETYIKGWRLVTCSACSGSGVYDNTGSPPCGGCNGTGKCRVGPEEYAGIQKYIAEIQMKNFEQERRRRLQAASAASKKLD